MKAQIAVLFIIVVNLLNIIWVSQIKFNRTINRRRWWKQYIVKAYFLLGPVMLVVFLLKINYIYFISAGFGLVGCWFAVSQLRFMRDHAGVPHLAEPVSFLHLIAAVALSGFSLMKLI